MALLPALNSSTVIPLSNFEYLKKKSIQKMSGFYSKCRILKIINVLIQISSETEQLTCWDKHNCTAVTVLPINLMLDGFNTYIFSYFSLSSSGREGLVLLNASFKCF